MAVRDPPIQPRPGDRDDSLMIGSGGPVVSAPPGELRLPEDLDTLPILAVLRPSPAWDAVMRLCDQAPISPGMVLAVSAEELASLREDLLVLAPTKLEGGV